MLKEIIYDSILKLLNDINASDKSSFKTLFKKEKNKDELWGYRMKK